MNCVRWQQWSAQHPEGAVIGSTSPSPRLRVATEVRLTAKRGYPAVVLRMMELDGDGVAVREMCRFSLPNVAMGEVIGLLRMAQEVVKEVEVGDG